MKTLSRNRPSLPSVSVIVAITIILFLGAGRWLGSQGLERTTEPLPRGTRNVPASLVTPRKAARTSLTAACRAAIEQPLEASLREERPEAVDALLLRVAALPDGDEKEEIAQLIAEVSNREAVTNLLSWVTQSDDRTASRAAATALARLADAELVQRIVGRYDVTSDDEIRARLLGIISRTKTEAVMEELMTLAKGKDRGSGDPLSVAAVHGLAHVGTPEAASHLLQRLDSAPGDEVEPLFQIIASINNDQARSVLEQAAQGNNAVISPLSRAAAIYALGNFPDERTEQVLADLASDASVEVARVAQETLRWVRGGPPPP
ncbi:MAG: HEAT repeat domain-containing protein [Verrucomicrobiales bacterium]|nr:HEAT repeat domain-containing protein [Verrucomicrobiales bacterium]